MSSWWRLENLTWARFGSLAPRAPSWCCSDVYLWVARPGSPCRELLGHGRAAQGLNHPQLVELRELSELGDELVAVGTFVHAEPLRALLRLSNFLRKPVPPAAGLQIAEDVLLALEAARSVGDGAGGLTPDSVLVSPKGAAHLLDLGMRAVAWQLGLGADNRGCGCLPGT